MLDAFSKEFKTMDVFNESNYTKHFEYKEMNVSLEQVNFCYLLDRRTFQQFAKQIGFHDHDMMEEEVSEVASTGPLNLKNDYLIDFAQTGDLGFRSHNPNFNFFSNVTKSELEESEVMFVSKRVLEFVRKMHPESLI